MSVPRVPSPLMGEEPALSLPKGQDGGDCEGDPPLRPLSSSATRRDAFAPNCPRRHYRNARKLRYSQLRIQQIVAESNSFRVNSGVQSTE